MFGLGLTEISIVAGIIVVIIAVRRAPALRRAFPKMVQAFKRSVGDEDPGEDAQERDDGEAQAQAQLPAQTQAKTQTPLKDSKHSSRP